MRSHATDRSLCEILFLYRQYTNVTKKKKKKKAKEDIALHYGPLSENVNNRNVTVNYNTIKPAAFVTRDFIAKIQLDLSH